jgi:hypothetical protein
MAHHRWEAHARYDVRSWLKDGKFWRGIKKISHVGHTETSEGLPFLIQDGCSVMV